MDISLKMNSWCNHYRQPHRFQWMSIAILAIATIGFTAQTPTKLVTRNPAPVARPKPVLGWNSFWPFGCGKDVNDKNLKWQADLMAEKGFIKAGYKTFIIECGWEVDPKGKPELLIKSAIVGTDPYAFREDFRKRDLHIGVGTWGGPQLCPRTKDEIFHVHPLADLDRYVYSLADWGVTYLSHRPCDWVFPDVLQYSNLASIVNSRYVEMEGAIKNTALQSKMFYATGQWGASPSAYQTTANSWRVADDTLDNWNSFIRTLNAVFPYTLDTKGPYNDLGFLQLGENKLTMAEKITQFSFWAAAKSPLIFSTDISRLRQEEIALLTNPRAIAINQDDLGQSITLKHRYSGDMDIWSGPLSDGSTVAVIINWSDDDPQKTIQLADLGFSSAHMYEVLTGNDLGFFKDSYSTTIEKHGSLFLKLTETKPAPQRNFKRFPVEMAEITGSAVMKDTSRGIKVAANLKPDGKTGVRWKNIPGAKNGNTLVSFDYINAQLSAGNMDNSKLNFKHTAIIINDDFDHPLFVDFPITGLTWENMAEGFLVSLPLHPGENTILVRGEGEWAPDFHCLSVEQTA
ncbi:hypothetical protein PGT21_031866 [Puccinia graminis f. sp. tritici]|uniref:Alpha-galactosidase n=1 Tax=Puccinia graminis f. sp. tritici TaxID=56615 RepID=A0A5B0QXR1_PUCGR|nr:hypothetical protein PGT21_031866 [Puccinia graminis f. sp. tritici]